jgi:hypothetical protein
VGRPKGVGLHSLRYFYASVLIRSGLSVRVVSERLGHANAAMALNECARLGPDEEDRTRRAVDELLGDAPAAKPTRTVSRRAFPRPRSGRRPADGQIGLDHGR